MILSFPDSEKPLALDTATLLEDAPETPRLQQFVNSYAQDAETRVAVIDRWGNVMADSHHPRHLITNQLDQVEVQAALQGSEQHNIRIDPITGESTLFVAAPINQNGRYLGVIRISQPMTIVTAPSRVLSLGLIGTSGVALLVTVIISIIISRRLVRPVQRLERAAMQIATGDLTYHVPIDRADELGALAGAFNYMSDEISRMFTQQRLFIANASHELRTPLTNIKLRSDALLRNHDDSAMTERYLDAISMETERLGQLAHDLLNLTKLESQADRTPEQHQPIDVYPILQRAYDMMELRAQSANIQLQLTLPDELPPLAVNPEQLEAIVINLLDNAIKYTPAGGQVTFAIQADPQSIQILVQDTGIGIPDEDIQHIFDPFYRVDKARSRSYDDLEGNGSGSGLGLTITNTLVQNNHGRISVESKPGEGTQFCVAFDVASTER